jgi:hypothetical protein
MASAKQDDGMATMVLRRSTFLGGTISSLNVSLYHGILELAIPFGLASHLVTLTTGKRTRPHI